MSATLNGHPILHHRVSPNAAEHVQLMFPKLIKPSTNFNVKGISIADIKINPDGPADTGRRRNVVMETCTFSRMVLFDNTNKQGVYFKCGNDEDTEAGVDFIKTFDAKILKQISGDGINYPKELGPAADRYKPIVKVDDYKGACTMEIRAEIKMDGDKPSDCILGEMREDGPVQITFQEFKEKYEYRPVKAILEMPYLVVMNSGINKTIAVKTLVKQLVLLPPVPKNGDVQDNSAFKFM
jgi:hypothetical protein